jgi:hypothetical protein
MRKVLRMRSTVVIGTFTLLAVACSSAGGTASKQTTPAPEQSTAIMAPAPLASSAASPLEGTWRSGRVGGADVEAVLDKAGLQKWVKIFLNGSEDYRGAGYNVFTLKIQDGNWTEAVAHSSGNNEVSMLARTRSTATRLSTRRGADQQSTRSIGRLAAPGSR